MMDDSSYLCFMFLASNGLVISNTCWLQVVTGLLVAEVNVNTMSELGSGGVSLVYPLKPILLWKLSLVIMSLNSALTWYFGRSQWRSGLLGLLEFKLFRNHPLILTSELAFHHCFFHLNLKQAFLLCSWSYLLIHYTLLVAYIARSSGILTNFLGIPMYETPIDPHLHW